jgi:hypothetical protein
MRISAFDSKEIQATILAMKGMDREVAKEVRAATKKMIQPEWQKAVAENGMTRLEGQVLTLTARAMVSNQNVTLKAGGVGRALTGGAKPKDIVHSTEFGGDQSAINSYSATSSKGKRYGVKNRHTRRQFRPRNRKGYVVYPAAAEIIPRLAALWVQTTVRTFYEAIEKR